MQGKFHIVPWNAVVFFFVQKSLQSELCFKNQLPSSLAHQFFAGWQAHANHVALFKPRPEAFSFRLIFYHIFPVLFLFSLFLLPFATSRQDLSTLKDLLRTLSRLNRCLHCKSAFDMLIVCLCRLGNLKEAWHAIETMVRSSFGLETVTTEPHRRANHLRVSFSRARFQALPSGSSEEESQHPQCLEFFIHAVEVSCSHKELHFLPPNPQQITN